MSPQNILLDSDIRDWVVLPLFVIMVSAGLLRVYLGTLLKPAPKNTSRVAQRTMSSIRATSTLKSGAIHFLSSSKLESRKLAYPEILRDQAEWCEACLEEEEKAKKENQDDDDMPNPLAQMEGMAGNMVFMVSLCRVESVFVPMTEPNHALTRCLLLSWISPFLHFLRSKIW